MKIPSWPFAFLRLGLVAFIYAKFAYGFGALWEFPLIYYGLPVLTLLALLGVHRYWMFPLGGLLLLIGYGYAPPPVFVAHGLFIWVLAFATIFAGFTPCDRDFSLRAWWTPPARLDQFENSPVTMFNLYRLMIFLLYARSLLDTTDVDFLRGEFFESVIMLRFFNSEFAFSLWIPAVCSVLAGMVWAFYLVACVSIWRPSLWRPFVQMAVGFHILMFIVTPARDYLNLLMLLLLLPLVPFAFKIQGPAVAEQPARATV